MKVQALRTGEWPLGVWHEPGDVFDYTGPPGEDLRPDPKKPGEFVAVKRKHPNWVIPAPRTKPGRQEPDDEGEGLDPAA